MAETGRVTWTKMDRGHRLKVEGWKKKNSGNIPQGKIVVVAFHHAAQCMGARGSMNVFARFCVLRKEEDYVDIMRNKQE